MLRQIVPQALLCQEHLRLGVPQHERQTLSRIAGVQRNVSAAGFEDPQQPDDHLQGPFHADAHQHVGADSEFAKAMCQLIGAGVQLTIRELLLSEDDCHLRRRTLDLGLEQLVNAGLLGEISPGVVPFQDQLLEFGLRQQGQVRQA